MSNLNRSKNRLLELQNYKGNFFELAVFKAFKID